ncbi:hypothetical protein C5167_024709 [Papaver somniferum]|uniref:DUF7796 domain-containing protein n=1 Tax=Papaver somniferum TaxID=3469 RepID=A0A4Y7JSE3_PAPSO|nr:uncharacterized protein LOC113280034 [Papaver somniferum]RZC62942.1 hypothetical protein C5167_024709 [Papaver somniferum]
MQLTRSAAPYLNFRLVLLLIFPCFSFFLFLSLSSTNNIFSTCTPLTNFLSNLSSSYALPPLPPISNSSDSSSKSVSDSTRLRKEDTKKKELLRSRIAVCLVGGARKFELTGPSIIENVLNVYPNADLFLNSPLDKDSFKFSILKDITPRIASIRIFKPTKLNETDFHRRVFTPNGSPHGIQGLLQYFSLVEGCLTLINAFQIQNNFTYDWIVRTRVDGYWNAPLSPDNFLPNDHYLVPSGSRYGGRNDRLGIGNLNTSKVALSRFSLIQQLDAAGFRQLNSETAFKAQLTSQGVKFFENRLPFCIVTAHKFEFPPSRYGLPVAAMSSPGPLSGAYCRPCTLVCAGPCVADIMEILAIGWGRLNAENGTVQLCNAHGEWESGWENNFDRFAGEKLAELRKRVMELKFEKCVQDFDEMKERTVNWDAPAAKQICGIALRH